jgi:hypothetical protein
VIKPKRIVGKGGIGFREQPPSIVAHEDRTIGEPMAPEQDIGADPFRWKSLRLIEPHAFRLMRFRDHVIPALPFEDIGVGQMKVFSQHNLLIGPGKAILAGGPGNFAPIGIEIVDLEEHVPLRPHAKEEGVGDK